MDARRQDPFSRYAGLLEAHAKPTFTPRSGSDASAYPLRDPPVLQYTEPGHIGRGPFVPTHPVETFPSGSPGPAIPSHLQPRLPLPPPLLVLPSQQHDILSERVSSPVNSMEEEDSTAGNPTRRSPQRTAVPKRFKAQPRPRSRPSGVTKKPVEKATRHKAVTRVTFPTDLTGEEAERQIREWQGEIGNLKSWQTGPDGKKSILFEDDIEKLERQIEGLREYQSRRN